jgi:hypothetical protein
MTWIAVATEDEPSEAVAGRLVEHVGAQVSMRLRKGGFGYLKASLGKFAEMARHQPVLLLTDLDRAQCPLVLIEDWTAGAALPPQLFFRVVQTEIESWLLADHEGFAEFLGVKLRRFPERPEELADPKSKVLELASMARSDIRSEMLPQRGSEASQGIGYSARLSQFARASWSIERAATRAPGLQRALTRLASAGLQCGCCA